MATDVDTLINQLQDSDPAHQCAAAWKLYDIGDEQAVDALVVALDSEDWVVRNAAAWALAKLKSKKAIAPLLSKFEQADQSTRVRMIELLAELADESLMEFFIDKLGDKSAIPFMPDALQDTSVQGTRVKVAAIQALAKIGDFRVSSVLLPFLRDTQEGVRLTAARALRNLGWLPETIEDEIAYFIAWKQWALIAEYCELAVEPLVILLNKDKDCWIAASNTLAKIQTRTAYKRLVKAYEETDHLRSAARTTSTYNLKQIIEGLIEKLDHTDFATRLHAIQSLGWIADQSAIKPLTRYLWTKQIDCS